MSAISNRAGRQRLHREGVISPKLAKLPSARYAALKAGQLEGTYPRDVGAHSITSCRVLVGWGGIPEDSAPRGRDWLLEDHPRPDVLAKEARIGFYERIGSGEDVKRSIANRTPVVVGLQITQQWMDVGSDGRIYMPPPSELFLGNHSVVIFGFDDADEGGRFRFCNSYGEEWGDQGLGSIPYAYFDRFIVDAFATVLGRPFLKPPDKEVFAWVGTCPTGHEFHGVEVWNREADEREGWTYGVVRDGFLDVEEFFVHPAYRGHRVSDVLARELQRDARERGLPLRAWIPRVDATRENLPRVKAVLRRLGLVLEPSPMQWARFVGRPPGLRTMAHR